METHNSSNTVIGGIITIGMWGANFVINAISIDEDGERLLLRLTIAGTILYGLNQLYIFSKTIYKYAQKFIQKRRKR